MHEKLNCKYKSGDCDKRVNVHKFCSYQRIKDSNLSSLTNVTVHLKEKFKMLRYGKLIETSALSQKNIYNGYNSIWTRSENI